MGDFLSNLDQQAKPSAAAPAATGAKPAASTGQPQAAASDTFLGSLDGATGVGKIPVDNRSPNGMTLFMDPSKFSAMGQGIKASVGGSDYDPGMYQDPKNGLTVGTPPALLAVRKQAAADVAAHPNYQTAGKVLGTTLLGGAGGAEAPVEGGLAKLLSNMSRSAGMADVSMAGAAAGNKLAPGNPLASVAGALIAPAAAGGALTALRQGGASMLNSVASPAADTAELQTLSRQQGIPLSVGDVTRNAGLNKLETVLESTPFSGMLKFREGQQQSVKGAAQDVLASAEAKVPEEFGDLNGQIQAAVTKTLKSNKAQAGKLYDAAAAAAPAKAMVPLTNMQKAAGDVAGIFSKNADVESPPAWTAKVQKYSQAQPRTYNDVMDLRKQITANQGAAGFGTPEALAWKQIKSGLDADTTAFEKSYPDSSFAQAQQAARGYYKANVAPFKDSRALSNVAQGKTDPDTLVTSWVKPNRPELVSKLMDNMDDQGKNALILSVLKKGFGTANLESDVKPYSAKTFSTYWNKLGTTKDVLFKDNPQMRQQLDGYAKLVDAVPSPVSNPPTGARNTPVLMGGAVLALAKTAGYMKGAALLATGRGLTTMLTQPWGQRMLITAAGSNDPGLVKRLMQGAVSNLQATAASPGTAAVVSQRISPRPAPVATAASVPPGVQ